jgi:excisionase family DNA binding protein
MKTRELYSIQEAKSLLGGISNQTIYKLLNSGELESVVIGRRRFVSAAAITSFIAHAATTVAPSSRRAIAPRRRVVQMPLELEPPPPTRGRRRIQAAR